MEQLIHVELLHKNIEQNYMYVAYYGENYTSGSNRSFDLKDFEEKTGIIWVGDGDLNDVDYHKNNYVPKIIIPLDLFLSIKQGI